MTSYDYYIKDRTEEIVHTMADELREETGATAIKVTEGMRAIARCEAVKEAKVALILIR